MWGLWHRDILSLEKEEKVRYYTSNIEGLGAFKFLVLVPGQGPGPFVLRPIRHSIDLPSLVPSSRIHDISLM